MLPCSCPRLPARAGHRVQRGPQRAGPDCVRAGGEPARGGLRLEAQHVRLRDAGHSGDARDQRARQEHLPVQADQRECEYFFFVFQEIFTLKK